MRQSGLTREIIKKGYHNLYRDLLVFVTNGKNKNRKVREHEDNNTRVNIHLIKGEHGHAKLINRQTYGAEQLCYR